MVKSPGDENRHENRRYLRQQRRKEAVLTARSPPQDVQIHILLLDPQTQRSLNSRI